jgi:hypothetical protein
MWTGECRLVEGEDAKLAIDVSRLVGHFDVSAEQAPMGDDVIFVLPRRDRFHPLFRG